MTGLPNLQEQAARLHTPEARAKVREHLASINRDPEVRRKQVASLLQNKEGLQRIRRGARAKLAAIRNDPERAEKRAAWEARRSSTFKATCARKLAAQYGFPVDLVETFRAARRKGLDPVAVVAVLRASYPPGFVKIDAAAARAARRAAGPLPAAGTEKRQAWIRSVAEVRP